MEISISRSQKLKAKPDASKLGFGNLFTDHMFNMDYDQKSGWHAPRIEPYALIPMDPATMFLHYGQGVFEGLKAYRTQSGQIQLFRPCENIKRLNRSCRRLCIPEVDENFALEALKKLVALEKDVKRRVHPKLLHGELLAFGLGLSFRIVFEVALSIRPEGHHVLCVGPQSGQRIRHRSLTRADLCRLLDLRRTAGKNPYRRHNR